MEFYKGDTVKYTNFQGEERQGIVQKVDKLLSVYIRESGCSVQIRPERAKLIKPGYKTPRSRRPKKGVNYADCRNYEFAVATAPLNSKMMAHRAYGFILRENEDTKTLLMYSGEERQFPTKHVAIYTQRPANWKALFEEEERLKPKVHRDGK